MSKRMNWRNARLDGKRSTSIVDEDEYRGKDAAARWLERKAKKPVKHHRKRPDIFGPSKPDSAEDAA